MHEAVFDRLAVTVLRRAPRRGVLAALAAATAGLPASADPASARKKKGCRFAKTPTAWTLRKSCTTTKTIRIPNGVTLDGAGFTIRAKGNAAKFGDGLIESAGATAGVKNLTLDARGVTGGCTGANGPQHGIFFGQADGNVEDTTVRGVCGWAIETGSAGVGKTLNVTGCAIDATGAVRGGVVARAGSITNTTVTNGATGFSLTDGVVTITGCTVTGTATGLSASAEADVTVTNSDFTVGRFGLVFEEGATGDISGNTIVGPGSFAGDTAGIVYRGGAGGDASGNAVSGFDDSVGSVGCGILIAADAGTVTLDTGGVNTFPSPPGNEFDVCDLQP